MAMDSRSPMEGVLDLPEWYDSLQWMYQDRHHFPIVIVN